MLLAELKEPPVSNNNMTKLTSITLSKCTSCSCSCGRMNKQKCVNIPKITLPKCRQAQTPNKLNCLKADLECFFYVRIAQSSLWMPGPMNQVLDILRWHGKVEAPNRRLSRGFCLRLAFPMGGWGGAGVGSPLARPCGYIRTRISICIHTCIYFYIWVCAHARWEWVFGSHIVPDLNASPICAEAEQ